MELSIVIVNFNVKYFVEVAITSALKACQGITAEIIVVDNHSSDNSVAYLSERFPQIKVIANQVNSGFAVANNQAIHISTGKYVLLLNPDTVVQEDTFSKCLTFMETHPDAGALGVRMLDGTGRFLPESKRAFPGPSVAFYKAFGLSALFPKSTLFGQYHLGYLDQHATHQVDVLAGAFMLLKREALDSTGLLDETFFMYGEDIDLSYRIRQAGYTNYYYPDAPIIHFKGESTRKGSLNYVQMFYNAMKIFARKHFSGQRMDLFIFLINLAIYFRAFLAIMARFFKQTAPILIDVLLIFTALILVKEYWEYYVRYIDGGKYPNTYIYVNIPLYTIIWIVSGYISGVYDKDSNAVRLIRAMFWGTVVIAALYGFFPDQLRFSRGMIIAGGAVSGFLLISARYFSHFLQKGNFRYGQNPLKRILVVGDEVEAEKVQKTLDAVGLGSNIIGLVGCAHNKQKNQLGSLKQLDEIIAVYRPGELVYCMADLSNGFVVSHMEKHAGRMEFKIMPASGNALVGSNSKNSAGEYYDIRFQIAQPYNKRIKRSLDIFIACILTLLLPVMWIFVSQFRGLIRNIFLVLSGKASWVGYTPSSLHSRQLPVLKPAVLYASQLAQQLDVANALVLDTLYAKEYTPGSDVRIILRSFRHLGQGPQ